MNFDRRHRPSNRRENDNKWTDRSDNRARDNFGNRRRDQNIGSNFRVRKNSFDNSVRSRDQNFRSEFQKREYFNEFTDQGGEKKFGSDFRMQDNSNDYDNRSHDRKFENDYQESERFNESSSQRRGTNFESDFRIREQSNENIDESRDSKFGNVYQEKERFNEFSGQGRGSNFGSDFRMREKSSDNGDQIRDRKFENDYQERERFYEFSDKGRGTNVENDFRIREQSSENSDESRDSKFRNVYQEKERFNEFSGQGRGSNFGNDFRMREKSSDNGDQIHDRKFENDYQERERFNEFSDKGRSTNVEIDFRMREQSSENSDESRDSKFGNVYQEKERFNEFSGQGRGSNFGSGFRMREKSSDNGDQIHDRKLKNDYQERERFNEFSDKGRGTNVENDFRIREQSSENSDESRDSKFGNVYQEKERFNEFSGQGRGTNIGSDFRIRDNYNDNSNQTPDRKFENDDQEIERFNQFSNQGREENFGNDKRMEGIRSHRNDIMNDGIRIYDDYSNLGRNNNLGNDNRMRDSSRDFFNIGRDSTLRSDGRIHDFSSHGLVNDLERNNYMRTRRESVNFGNQGRGNNFPNDDRMQESFKEFGYGNRDNNFRSIQIPGTQIPNKQVDFYQRSKDNTFFKPDPIVASTVGSNIRQNTFDDQDRYVNRDSNKTRDNDDMFKNYLQGTKIPNIKRFNENYWPQKPEIWRQNTSINYPKVQEGTKLSNQPNRKTKKRHTSRQAFLAYMKEQSIIRAQKETDKNKPEIKREKKESDVVRATPSKNIDKKIESLRNGLNDIIAVKFSDKSKMAKSTRRKLNKQAWHAKIKQVRKLKSAITRKHRKVYLEKKREMDNNEQADEDQGKPINLCLIIKDCGHIKKQISKSRQDWFEKALSDKIENGSPGSPRPIFTFATSIDGVYKIICADEFTYGWVRANVPRLQLWKRAQLKVTRDMMKEIRYIPASPKPSIDFEPISEKDLNADLFNRNNIHGKIVMTHQLKIMHAISGLIPRGSHLPYNFAKTARGSLSIECKDLTSLQWLYDHLSVLDGLLLDADLRLIQRRTLLYFRKITFTLKRQVRTTATALTRIALDNDTIRTGLWRPLQLHPDGQTLSYAIEEESVKDLEALGSRIKYFGHTIDVHIHPRDETQVKRNIDSLSVIQEIDNYELTQTSIADLSDAENNASAATDDN